jgi:quercetin dioxygenase-like cupin family protein
MSLTEQVHDPVSRTRYAFEPQGDDMVVYTWLEPGGGLVAHMNPRQEERWSVLEGQVRFQLGRGEACDRA